MTIQKNKLSIILPTYNGADLIDTALKSILEQDFTDYELIIINDCSTDNTLEIINEYAKKDSRIKVISNEINLKIPKSLNVGFSNASGEYYTWTSDDNFYKPGALKFMVDYLDNNTDIDLVSCAMDMINEDNSLHKKTDKLITRKSAGYLASYCNVGGCFMYRKSIADTVGKYDENLFAAEDYDYWCRIALAGKISYVEDNFYNYKIQSQSISSTKAELGRQRTGLIQTKYAEQLLEKYPLFGKDKANICYGIWKKSKEPKYLKEAFKSAPFRSLVRFVMYYFREGLRNKS